MTIRVLSLLLLIPALEATAAAPCAGQLAPKIRGESIDDKIRFLESGQPEICPRSINQAECNSSFRFMATRLRDHKAAAESTCLVLEAGKKWASTAPAKGQTHFTLHSQNVINQKASLEKLRDLNEATEQAMQVIRLHTAHQVKAQITGRSPASTTPQTGDPKFLPLATSTLHTTLIGTSDPAKLRAEILALSGHGNERAVNSLWAAANALELEQHFGSEKRKLVGALKGLGRVAGDTSTRDASMKSVADRGPGGGSPLSDILSSPALPAALMAAAQMAAAQNKGEASQQAAEVATGSAATAPTPSSPAAPLLPSPLGPKGESQAGTFEATAQSEETKREGKKEAENGATYARPDGPGSKEAGISGGSKATGLLAARSAPPGTGGSGGGDTPGSEGPVTGKGIDPPSSQMDRQHDSFLGGGGGGSSGGFSGDSQASQSPSEPEKNTALENILADDSPSGDEAEAGNGKAAGGAVAPGEKTLFVQVHAAYVRSLKSGVIDVSSRELLTREKLASRISP